MLTGKYGPDRLPSGFRKLLYEKLEGRGDYDHLLGVMKDVAAVRNATLPQVALNWVRAKGAIPIPGARTLSQVEQNYQSLEWSLSPEEVRSLDVSGSAVTTFTKPGDARFAKEDILTHLKLYDS